MSDNKAGKNAVYEQIRSNSLPYGKPEALEFGNSTTVTASRLNSVFMALVDNDKVAERHIACMSAYQVGPNTYDEQAIRLGPNGYKVWKNDADTELSILRKIDRSLQDSVTYVDSINCSEDQTVRFVCGAAGKIFAGTKCGLYCSEDGKEFDIFDERPFNAVYTDAYQTFFAGDEGLFQLNSQDITIETETGTTIDTMYFLSRRDTGGLSGCRSVYVRNDIGRAYVGTNNGIYCCTVTSNPLCSDMSFENIIMLSGDAEQKTSVNDFATIGHNAAIQNYSCDVLAACGNGVYQNREIFGVTGCRTLFSGEPVIGIVNIGGSTYAVIENCGLYDVKTGECLLPVQGLQCFVSSSEAVYVGSPGKVTRFSVFGANNWTVSLNKQNVGISHIYLANPNHRNIQQELVVGLKTDGSMFTVDVNGNVYEKYDLLANAIHVDSRNVLAYSPRENSKLLSTFDVKDAYKETGDAFGQLSSYALDGEHILAYVQPKNENRPVDKWIYSTDRKVVDLSTGKQYTGQGPITAFRPLHYSGNSVRYAAVDFGKLVALGSEMQRIGTADISGAAITDTSSLIVTNADNKISYVRKINITSGFRDTLVDLSGDEPVELASDGRVLYWLSGGTLSAALETPALCRSTVLSGVSVYDVTGTGLSNVLVATTRNGVEFHQLSNMEDADLSDTVSAFQCTAYGCKQINDDQVEVYTDTGISSFVISAQADGTYSILSASMPEYSGTAVYARQTADIRNIEFVATQNGLCAYAGQFNPLVSNLNIRSGCCFAQQAYAVKSGTGLDFYLSNQVKLQYGKEVSGLAPVKSHVSDEISVYFGNSDGLSCVCVSSTETGYEYQADGIKLVTDRIQAAFVCPITEISGSDIIQRDALVATDVSVYTSWQTDTPVYGFGEIRAIDCCAGTVNNNVQLSVFASDAGTLNIGLPGDEPSYTKCEGLSDITHLAVCVQPVASEDEQMQVQQVLFVRKNDGDVFGFNFTDLGPDSSYGNSMLSRTACLRKDDQNPGCIFAYVNDGGYKVYRSNGNEFTLEYEFDDEIVSFQPNQLYMTSSDVFEYSSSGAVLSPRRCVQISCSSDEQRKTGTCLALFEDGNALSAGFGPYTRVQDIRLDDANPVMKETVSFQNIDGTIVRVLSRDRFDDGTGSRDLTYDFSKYTTGIRRVVVPNAAVRSLFGVSKGQYVFAAESGVYFTDTDRSTLEPISAQRLSGQFDSISESNGFAYAISSDTVYELTSAAAKHIKTYSYQIARVIKAGNRIYAKTNELDTWIGERDDEEYIENCLDGVNVVNIIDGTDSAGIEFGGEKGESMLVATDDGLMRTDRVKPLVINLDTSVRCRQFDGDILSVYGTQTNDGTKFNVAYRLSSSGKVKYCEYDYQSNSLDEGILCVSFPDGTISTEFTHVWPTGNDIKSGTVFATVSGDFDICETNNRELTEYNDIRPRLADARINSVWRANGETYICTKDGIFVSKGRGWQQIFNLVYGGPNFTGIAETDRNRYLFSSSSGMYTFYNTGREVEKSIYKNEVSGQPECFVTKYTSSSGGTVYATADSCSVLTSDNGKIFRPLVILPQPDCGPGDGECPDLSVFGLYALNSNEYYFATSNGMYKTDYQYDLSNDVRRFTVADARAKYESMAGELSCAYQTVLSDHTELEHSPDSTITYVNECLIETNFGNIDQSDWHQKTVKTDESIEVRNDMAFEILFGDQDSGDIYVNTSNFLEQQSNVKCSYIFKRYMSGISELYVYVPTTWTYYVNHIDGTPHCSLYETSLKRANLKRFGALQEFVSDMQTQYTTFDLAVDSTFVNIDTMLGVQVNGNSLPLKVYRDTTYSGTEGPTCLMYHSFVEPSRLLTPITAVVPDSNGEYHLRFACFGSDAQAIRISFYDTQTAAGANTYKVIFHANGGSGSMTPQRFAIGVSRKLRKCSFTGQVGTTKVFGGWTFTVNPPDNGAVEYSDQQDFSLSDAEPGNEYHLYAVWMTYQKEQASEIALADTNGELYIASGEILEDENLGNKTVIDYGK